MRLNQRETLLAMGDYIEEHGFSPRYVVPGTECGCFSHAMNAVSGGFYFIPPALGQIIGSSIDESDLRDHGWNESAASTRDAAAACRIAADLVTK